MFNASRIHIAGAAGLMPAVLLAAAIVTGNRTATASAADDAFFNDGALVDVQLALSSRDWQTLKANAALNTYYPATLTWKGVATRNVGIRSRGTGTRSGIKPGLHVDLNRYLPNQTFLGLHAFELKNMYTDASLMRERLVMKLFAKMGLAAPRQAHARLFVNGEYVGVYVLSESIDRTFISRLYGAAEADVERGGYLFEYVWRFPYGFEYLGSGLEAYAPMFKPETRATDALVSIYAPIEELIQSVNEASDEDFRAVLARELDVSSLLRYLAIELFTVEWDGLAGNWGVNNFYLYRFRGAAARPVFLPWDRDHAFIWDGVHADDFIAAPVTIRLDTNVLTRRIMADAELRGQFEDDLARVAAAAAESGVDDPRGWLLREIERERSLIAPALLEDPVYPFTPDAFSSEVGFLEQFAQQRPTIVNCQLQERRGEGACQ